MPVRKCNWCKKGGDLKCCSSCELIDYCGKTCQLNDWKHGHKIICRKVPQAVAEAASKIDSFRLSDYRTKHVGTFMVTEAEAQRGQILDEHEAQEYCYDAMEMVEGSPDKIKMVLKALEKFPLSTEAWGMIGHFYSYEVNTFKDRTKECAQKAVKMQEYAIRSARILNPTWAEDRAEELPWGEIDNRPYLRAVCAYAIALKDTGKLSEAIEQAEHLLRWNPSDNQGVRQMLCNWYLQEKNTEDCLYLLRDYNPDDYEDVALSYSAVLLQFQRWKKGKKKNDKLVKEALYKALKVNPYVPDILISGNVRDNQHDSVSSDGQSGADNYVYEAHRVWKANPEAIEWLKAQKFDDGVKLPSEDDLIHLLKNQVRVNCEHTDLNGRDKMMSTIKVTQTRNKCIGCALEDFFWPEQLNRPHNSGRDILMHRNEWGQVGWRKTKYSKVIEVPFWNIFLQFTE